MTFAARYCVICNTPLTSVQARAEKLCGGSRCRTHAQTLPRRAACAVCGKHLTLHERAGNVCSDAQCRIESMHEESRRRREHIRIQAEQLRDNGAQALGIDRPRAYSLAIIPSLTVPLVNTPERRRRAFRDRLMEVIGEATQHTKTPTQPTELSMAVCKDAPPTASEPVQALLGAACATCRGHCCATGGIHAYLSADTIRRFMNANPDMRPRDILAAYLSHLPSKSLKGSCIYHTAQGCALPRDMRSDISLRYFCQPLWDFQRELAESDEPKGFVAAADNRRVVRAAFVSESEIRPVPAPTE